MDKKIIIIGGGPAGIMAAISAARIGGEVILLEKNDILGKKLLLTGNGRCNLSYLVQNDQEFIEAFGKKGSFLHSITKQFSIKDTLNFFKNIGIKTKVEKDGRIFPITDTAQDVRNALIHELRKQKVEIKTNIKIKGITLKNNSINQVQTNVGVYSAAALILACGGLAHPETGSTGDGYIYAKRFGHHITAAVPALVPVIVSENWIEKISGISLSSATVGVYINNKKKKEMTGDVLFTHQGLSGPLIFNLNSIISNGLNKGKVELKINLISKNESEAEKFILQKIDSNSKKLFINIINEFVADKLAQILLIMNHIDLSKLAQDVKKDERKKIIQSLCNFTLTVKKFGSFKQAMATNGGLLLSELDPISMRSKIINNLFFAGEIIDLVGPCGGYNLQLCWSSGWISGKKAALML